MYPIAVPAFTEDVECDPIASAPSLLAVLATPNDVASLPEASALLPTAVALVLEAVASVPIAIALSSEAEDFTPKATEVVPEDFDAPQLQWNKNHLTLPLFVQKHQVLQELNQ